MCNILYYKCNFATNLHSRRAWISFFTESHNIYFDNGCISTIYYLNVQEK